MQAIHVTHTPDEPPERVAVPLTDGVLVEGHPEVIPLDHLDPACRYLFTAPPHGGAFLPNRSCDDLTVMAWLLAPWHGDYGLRFLAGWLKVELPAFEHLQVGEDVRRTVRTRPLFMSPSPP